MAEILRRTSYIGTSYRRLGISWVEGRSYSNGSRWISWTALNCNAMVLAVQFWWSWRMILSAALANPRCNHYRIKSPLLLHLLIHCIRTVKIDTVPRSPFPAVNSYKSEAQLMKNTKITELTAYGQRPRKQRVYSARNILVPYMEEKF